MIKNKINSWIRKIFKSDKSSNIFHTTEDIYFTREEDGWLEEDYPKYSYKDFNKNENFRSYIKNGSQLKLYFNDKVISEAHFIVNVPELEKITFQFGWITSSNAFWGGKSMGSMTFLVASIIYIMLNDRELIDRDIEVSLEIQSDAKRLLEEKNIDVYHHIFRTPKICNNHKDNYRKYIFETKNRNNDIDYFKKILIQKEESIMNANVD